MELASLIAGVALATFPYSAEFNGKIKYIRDFFITLFFAGRRRGARRAAIGTPFPWLASRFDPKVSGSKASMDPSAGPPSAEVCSAWGCRSAGMRAPFEHHRPSAEGAMVVQADSASRQMSHSLRSTPLTLGRSPRASAPASHHLPLLGRNLLTARVAERKRCGARSTGPMTQSDLDQQG